MPSLPLNKDATYDQIGQVMDAVVEHRPDWAIQAARQQAERIIESDVSH